MLGHPLFQLAFDGKSKKSYIIPPSESPPQFFTEKLKDPKRNANSKDGQGRVGAQQSQCLEEARRTQIELS